MEAELGCLKCGADIEVGWDNYLEVTSCPKCGARFNVGYDDGYVEEENEEYPYWWLEEVTP